MAGRHGEVELYNVNTTPEKIAEIRQSMKEQAEKEALERRAREKESGSVRVGVDLIVRTANGARKVRVAQVIRQQYPPQDFRMRRVIKIL